MIDAEDNDICHNLDYEYALRLGKDTFLMAVTAYSKYLDNMVAVKKYESELAGQNKTLGSDGSDDDAVYDRMLELKKKIGGLETQAGVLYERCEAYFRKSIDIYKEFDDRMGAPEDCVEFFRGWGTSVYAHAVIKMDMALYNDAKKLFEDAAAIYGRIDGERRGDELERRLGNAYYEMAAVSVDSCLYEEARKSFTKARKLYENIKTKNVRDRRRLGNSLFELGRLGTESFLMRRESEDALYKQAIKDEAIREAGSDWAAEILKNDLDGCFIYAESDECHDKFGVEALFDDEPASVRSLVKENKELIYGAIKEFAAIGVAKVKNDGLVDVFRNWGEAHSLLGRMYRYRYLTILKKVESMADDESVSDAAWEKIMRRFAASVSSAAKHFARALDMLRKARDLDEDNAESEKTWVLLGATYYRLYLAFRLAGGRAGGTVVEWLKKDAEGFFRDSKLTVLDIFVALGTDIGYPMMADKTLFPLLDGDNAANKDAEFFENVVGAAGGAVDAYKEVYIRSMYIISRLEVKSENGKVVAHYTTKPVSQQMVFRGMKFGLYASRYFNDPDEGEILLEYLFGKKGAKQGRGKLKNERNEYVTFAGSFSFDYDNLNLFRLYGREGGREGTGLSLVFHRTFFREELEQDRAAYLDEIKEDVVERKGEDWWNSFVSKLKCKERKQRKNVLFRCAYFDPEKNAVETVGQKEESLFYREKKAGDYDKYKIFIDSVVVDVNDELKALKTLLGKNPGLDAAIVAQLTLKLRFLVKHVNFKEEQECRIVKNRRITGERVDAGRQDRDEAILIGSEEDALTEDLKMHLEYDLNVAQHVKEIYFGPKVSETSVEMFRKCLVHRGLGKIACRKSMTRLA